MRTTLNIDDALLDEAQRLTGMRERTALIHEGLRALIERESARRLADRIWLMCSTSFWSRLSMMSRVGIQSTRARSRSSSGRSAGSSAVTMRQTTSRLTLK